MRAIHTSRLGPADLASMSEEEKLWIYNGLDCCVTAEVLDALLPQLNETTQATYDFSLALQAPALEMKLRGVLIDQEHRDEVTRQYKATIARLSSNLTRIVKEGIGLDDFLWSSPAQLKRLLHDVLGIPPLKKQSKT